MTAISNSDMLVTIFGASGFLGRHVVRALAGHGYRMRAAVRRPDLAGPLQPLGGVGQIHAVQANLRHPASVEAAVRDSAVVINLVGILFERGRQRFAAVHAGGAEVVARATAAHGARLIHVSAIGADENATARYARTKGLGEKAVFAAVPEAVFFALRSFLVPTMRSSLPIRLSPTATSGSVRPCSWTFTSVAIFGSHNRSQSSSDFFPTTRPAPPTWRRLAGATGLFAPIVRRRESRSASQIVLASCAAASAAVTPD